MSTRASLTPSRKLQMFAANPWRFKKGDSVWVRGWGQDPDQPSGKILKQVVGMPFPHYLVRDFLGGLWQISQLELSGSYVGERK